ncbi:MAG TPA: hydroxymethylcytosylglucuronate/cytosylglucuronate synthase [Micromonosporaceae bacterium]|nr:hydroxymethylcytosylglucuronate/cytosylglucuronate synthase [Micromonosporaceae bacterium]
MSKGVREVGGRAPAIAVCGVDFGWGSAGKLRAVLRACRALRDDLRVVVLGTRLGRPVLADQAVEAWYEHWPRERRTLGALLDRHGVAAGLVVLDPAAAEALEEAGCRTVFLDSLPYLWTAADALPFNVTAYCAQYCPQLPRPSWDPLRRVARLHWVEGVMTGPPAGPRDRSLAVLNLGGLHSPANPDGNPTYLSLVLAPALAALARAGYRTVHACGNISAVDIPETARVPAVTIQVGPRPHAEFLALLARAGLLLTSPGLTTLLEASSQATPTVCLPPQNLSQILNGDRFATIVDAGCRVSWPVGVLDLGAVEQARVHGEEAGLAEIDRVLRSHDPAAVHPRLLELVEAAILRAGQVRSWSALADDTGRGGAHQVAQVLLGIVAEPVAAERRERQDAAS